MDPTELLLTVDKSQVPALEKKRILAFVNHFIISTCNFLNNFVSICEGKFVHLERKMQKIEASLLILETKLNSIPADTFPTNNNVNETPQISDGINKITQTPEDSSNTKNCVNESSPSPGTTSEGKSPGSEPASGVYVFEDIRYKKFFKMIMFGVPPEAVKIKMRAEGYDDTLLE